MNTAPSLTLRLAALFALTSTLLLGALGGAIYVASDRHFVEQDAHDLHGRVQIVANLIGRYDAATLPAALDEVLVSHHDIAVMLFDAGQRPLYTRSPEVFATAVTTLPNSSHSARDSASPSSLPHAEHPATVQTFRHNGQTWRSFSQVSPGDGPIRQIWLAIGIDHHIEFLDRLLHWLLAGGAAAALASGGLGFWVARRGLSPLQKISANATLISAQRLSARLDESNMPRELLPLVRELNAMLARLDDAFRRLSDFSSDIAHELRTPISNLMTQTEVALTRARNEDEYRDVLASNLEEFGRLSRMIGDMLFLARAEHGLLVPARQSVALGALADDLLSFYDALAETRGLRLERHGEATVGGDPLMLRRALANLLSNAIRHAAADSTITLSIAAVGSGAEIAVENRGDTIPAEHLPRLFDRFYRADFARQRSSESAGKSAGEGTGLGLGIVKSIVDAHRGRISVDSADGRTCFRIALP